MNINTKIAVSVLTYVAALGLIAPVAAASAQAPNPIKNSQVIQSVPSSTPTPIVTPAVSLSFESPKVTTSPAPVVSIPSTQCEEDEPCWDCTTMGNQICGPTSTPASLPTNTLKSSVTIPVTQPTKVSASTSKPLPTSQKVTEVPQPTPASTPASTAPVPCNTLKLGDGGTTQQNNCIPTAGQPAPHATQQYCVSTEQLYLDGRPSPTYCYTK